jgi:hypothetical protein
LADGFLGVPFKWYLGFAKVKRIVCDDYRKLLRRQRLEMVEFVFRWWEKLGRFLFKMKILQHNEFVDVSSRVYKKEDNKSKIQ